MQKEKIQKISRNLSVNRDNYMDSLRKNLDMFLSQTNFTIKGLSDAADIPPSTLNNILYSNLSDCKVSTIVRLARALHVSVDELLGSGTLSDEERYSLASARSLPEHSRYLIQWFIHRQLEIQNNNKKGADKIIPIMLLETDSAGNLHTTNKYHKLDITHLPDDKRPQIFLGIKLGCDYYMPYYTPYDILLIANDRKPKSNENSVIIYGNQVFIAHRQVDYEENHEIARYYNIRNDRFFVNEEDVDETIGYIVQVLVNV